MKRASPPAPLSLRVHFARGSESLFAVMVMNALSVGLWVRFA